MSFIRNHRFKIIIILWIVLSVVLSFILSKYFFYTTVTDKKFFGIIKETSSEFNLKLFIALSCAALLALFIYLISIKNRKIKQFLTSKRSYFSQKSFLLILTLIAIAFYFTGLFTPLYKSEHFIFFKDEISLWNSIGSLFEYQETYLAILILVFTIILPVVKFLLILAGLLLPSGDLVQRLNHWMSVISKWSMLDVFIVALLFLTLKFDSRIVKMELKSGIVWFSLSIIMILLILTMMHRKEGVITNDTSRK